MAYKANTILKIFERTIFIIEQIASLRKVGINVKNRSGQQRMQCFYKAPILLEPNL